MLLDNILLLIIIFFVSMFLICYFKMKNKKEQFINIFHIVKPINDNDYSYKANQVIIKKSNDDFTDKDKYNADLHQDVLTLSDNQKLYIGNTTTNEDSIIDHTFLEKLNTINFPYIHDCKWHGDEIQFNLNYGYIGVDHIKGLKGEKLLSMFGFNYRNKYGMKMVPETSLFEKMGYKCGYDSRGAYNKGKVTGIINPEYRY